MVRAFFVFWPVSPNNNPRIISGFRSILPYVETFPNMNGAPDFSRRLARSIAALRREQRWSLDDLSAKCGVSRATLSRLENGETSPTAEVLNQLCSAYGLSVSRLMMMIEDSFPAHVMSNAQPEHEDSKTGHTTRQVSPAAPGLQAIAVEGHLPPDIRVDPDLSNAEGREHHLVLLDGAIKVSVASREYDLTSGDCLRFHLSGPLALRTGPNRGARYLLFQV